MEEKPDGNIVGVLRDTVQGTNPVLLGATGLLIVTVVALIITSVVYVVRVLGEMTQAGLQSNPLNAQSFEHRAATSFQAGSNRYLPFVIVPPVVVVASVAGLWAMFRYPDAVPAAPLVRVLMIVLLLLGILLTVVNASLYAAARKQVRPIQDRIRLFNLYVNRRITKDARFLGDLLNVNTNPFLAKDVVRNALRRIAPGTDAESLAQYLFTVNLYQHFQKLGPRNPYFIQAMEVFMPLNILNLDRFRPSDYLYSKITFIEDVSTSYIGTSSTTALPQAMFANTKVVNDAAVLANEWTSEATNLANSFYARDAVYPFLNLVVVIALVQFLVLIPILWLLWTPSRREAVVNLVGRALAKAPIKPAVL